MELGDLVSYKYLGKYDCCKTRNAFDNYWTYALDTAVGVDRKMGEVV